MRGTMEMHWECDCRYFEAGVAGCVLMRSVGIKHDHSGSEV